MPLHEGHQRREKFCVETIHLVGCVSPLCMHGYGLCLWRRSRFEEAEHVFDRMLWLNSADNQDERFLTADVRARTQWADRRE